MSSAGKSIAPSTSDSELLFFPYLSPSGSHGVTSLKRKVSLCLMAPKGSCVTLHKILPSAAASQRAVQIEPREGQRQLLRPTVINQISLNAVIPSPLKDVQSPEPPTTPMISL